jgi:predicted metallopeptidase
MINYLKAPDVEVSARNIINALNLSYIDADRVAFYRSTGSKSRRIQARIHGLGRIWFDALNIQPRYIIEVISEEFDKLDPTEKDKVIIHELMHIPSGFSGGFVPHRGKINKRTVDAMYKSYWEASRRFSNL